MFNRGESIYAAADAAFTGCPYRDGSMVASADQPIVALEENLQFITWLGIIYNSYWTRLAYTSDPETVQTELEDATDDAIAKIKELMSRHSERNASRPGFGR